MTAHLIIEICESNLKGITMNRYIFRLICITLLIVILLSACAPQATQALTTDQSQVSLASSTTTPQVSVAPTTSTSQKTGASTVLSDVKMARLRLADLVVDSDPTDMYIDGQIVTLGERQVKLVNVQAGFIPGFVYLEPGKHSVAIVSTGKGLDAAIIAQDVNLEAGHRYSLLVMGQLGEAKYTPLVIDETATIAKIRTSPDQNIMILVNNFSGANSLTFQEDGVGPNNVTYGGFVAAPIKTGHVSQLVVTANSNDKVNDNPGNFDEASGIDFIHSYDGKYLGATDTSYQNYDSALMSDLNAIDLLQQLSQTKPALDSGQILSFTTLLAALKTAGLTDMLISGTYFILAPTEDAFDQLPKDQLAALMADPKALDKFLRNYIVAGYYPYGGISGATLGETDATVKNLLGTELTLNGSLSVNGVQMDDSPSFFALNGTRILPVTRLLPSVP
jgi:Fasciclin domain/Domain of unknown function (DUF4397)